MSFASRWYAACVLTIPAVLSAQTDEARDTSRVDRDSAFVQRVERVTESPKVCPHRTGRSNFILRPQMRVGITDRFLVGIAGGIPVNREEERVGTFLRFIYETRSGNMRRTACSRQAGA